MDNEYSKIFLTVVLVGLFLTYMNNHIKDISYIWLKKIILYATLIAFLIAIILLFTGLQYLK